MERLARPRKSCKFLSLPDFLPDGSLQTLQAPALLLKKLPFVPKVTGGAQPGGGSTLRKELAAGWGGDVTSQTPTLTPDADAAALAVHGEAILVVAGLEVGQ